MKKQNIIIKGLVVVGLGLLALASPQRVTAETSSTTVGCVAYACVTVCSIAAVDQFCDSWCPHWTAGSCFAGSPCDLPLSFMQCHEVLE